jgi:hypothetical protein
MQIYCSEKTERDWLDHGSRLLKRHSISGISRKNELSTYLSFPSSTSKSQNTVYELPAPAALCIQYKKP